MYNNISLAYSTPQPPTYYKDILFSYLRYLHRLNEGSRSRCVTVCYTSDNSLLSSHNSLPGSDNSPLLGDNSPAIEDTSQITPSNNSPPSSAHIGRVLCLTANSSRIFSSGDDRFIKCWDRQTLLLLGEREGMVSSSLDCTEEVMVAGLYNGCIMVYSCGTDDVTILSLMASCSRHMGPVSDVMVTGELVVSGSSDCSVRVWRVSDGECLGVYRDHDTPINKVLLKDNMDMCRVFSLSTTCVNVWSFPDNTRIRTLKPIPQDGKDVYFQPGLLCCNSVTRSNALCCNTVTRGNTDTNHGNNKHSILVCGSSHGFYMWDAANYSLLRIVCSEVCLRAGNVVGVGSALIAAILDDGLAVINTTTGNHVATIQIPQFNSSNCGLWVNKANSWLDGVFECGEGPLFIVTTLAGEICSLYLDR